MKMCDVNCANCNKTLTKTEKQIENSKTGLFFCNQDCFKIYRKNNSEIKPNVECANCQKPLYRNASLRKLNKTGLFFCDKNCKGQYETKLYKLECSECGKTIIRKGSELHRNSNKYFCDASCSNKYHNRLRDLKTDYECDYCKTIFKIQESQKKNNKKIYCSRECKNKDHHTFVGGEKNVFWNPNLTEEERLMKRKTPEYSEWRTKVFERDNYKCVKCNGRGSSLNAHHILNHSEYKELRLSTDNGITLCYECHKEFHKRFGWKKNNEKQLKEFIKNS